MENLAVIIPSLDFCNAVYPFGTFNILYENFVEAKLVNSEKSLNSTVSNTSS